jgi:hypothetical protein
LIENNRNLITFFKVDDYPRELWGSTRKRVEEEYSPKREMRMGIGNILDGGTRSPKILSGQSSVDIPKNIYNMLS